MRRTLAAALLSLVPSLVPSLLAAQTTIATGGGDVVHSFGPGSTPTYGQTFVAPTNGDTRLDQFSFWLQPAPSMNLRGYVFAWDDAQDRVTGPALFTSTPFAGPAGSGFQRVDVGTGGVNLVGGTTYVAFLSTLGLAGSGAIEWEFASPGNQYADGAFVYANGGDLTQSWDGGSGTYKTNGGDARFELTFNATSNVVPEPGTWALLATGLVAVGGIARRRVRAS